MKEKIACLYTGGTIGMKNSPQGLIPSNDFQEKLAEILPAKYELIWRQTELIDSSAISLQDWQKWLLILQELNTLPIKTLIIFHGTDTLAYTANLFSLMNNNFSFNLIFTAAQRSIFYPNSDAILNIKTAFLVAENSLFNNQSVISFGGKIHSAIGASKFSTVADSGIFCPFIPAFARYIKSENSLKVSNYFLNNKNKFNFNLKNNLILNPEVTIASFNLIPGFQLDFIADSIFNNNFDGIILQSFGNGNIKNHQKLFTAIKNKTKNNIPVINISQCPQGEVNNNYAQSSFLTDTGIISGGRVNLELVTSLLTLATSNNWTLEEIREIINKFNNLTKI
ncbi:MAG: asparaginase [Cardiobacteriaceae bacterium]|nr:asparaginase [Cardiobacteriaceae bacterium]